MDKSVRPEQLNIIYNKLLSELTFETNKNLEIINDALTEAYQFGCCKNTTKIKPIIENHYFECVCLSPEHTLKFTLDQGDNYPDLHTSIYLNSYQSWYKKLWIGIKYIFGYPCKYGHWDTFHLTPEDTNKLINLLERYQNLCQK